jgi:hypothetical protein
MTRAWWLLSLGLFAGSAPAFAGDDCSPVDLREQIGTPFHQGDSSYCFAHTASSLIQARTGFRASPMALAVGYLLTNPDDLSGGTAAVREKLTPEWIAAWRHDRNAEPSNLDSDKILTLHGLLDTGGDEEPTIMVSNFQGLCPESRLPTGKDVYKKYLRSIREFHASRVSRGVPAEGAIGEVTNLEAQAKAWSYRHWVEKHCGTPATLKEPLIADGMSLAKNLKDFRRQQALLAATALRLNQGRVMDAVNRQLDRGNPVAIGYALADLMPGEAAEDSDSPRPEDHASVFAARRKSGGRCYYYLRNSFGQEKGDYLPSLKGRFEDGGVWVLPEEIPSLYSAVWLR